MDYKKHHDAIIERALVRPVPQTYVERHHIVPKCLGGSNKKDNLVYLTPEEHYVVHQLLVKMYPSVGKLIYAARMLSIANKSHKRASNKEFGWIRRRSAAEVSKRMLGKKRPEISKNMMGHTRSKGVERPDKRKPLVIEGVVYPSRIVAAKHYDVNICTIASWLRTGRKNTYNLG